MCIFLFLALDPGSLTESGLTVSAGIPRKYALGRDLAVFSSLAVPGTYRYDQLFT